MATGLELLLAAICYNATFCGSYYDNTIWGEQLTRKQNRLLKLKEELNGKHLTVGTYNILQSKRKRAPQNYPFNWAVSENGTNRGRGVAFVLVEILSQRLNFSYDVLVPDKNYEMGGDKAEDSLIGLLNSSKVDFAAAFIPVISNYQNLVGFSQGLDEAVWLMMLKRPKESATGSGLLAPFESNVWFLILIAVFSFGPCITLLTRLRYKMVSNEESTIKISPSVWFVYGALIKQGTTLSPEANTTRVLFATWWIFIILLSAFYTANLTAFLTLSKFTLDIESPQDLYKKNYRWVTHDGGAVEIAIRDVRNILVVLMTPNDDLHYLFQMEKNGRAEFRSVPDDVSFLPIVSAGAVLIREEVSLLNLMFQDYVRKTREGIAEDERCTYVLAPNAFMKKMRSFAYPKNSTLKELFDPILSNLVQAGIVKFLMHRDLPSTKICPLDLQSKDRKLRNGDLLMTYFIMVAGLAAASATFIGELFIKRYLSGRLKGNKSRKKKRKSMKTSKVYFDDSHPPPYESLFSRDRSQCRVVNGREYYVFKTPSGDQRLIPLRTPSAFLYERTPK